MTEHNESQDQKTKQRRHFYVKRQQFIDEILFDPTLKAIEKNVGRMIATSVNPDTGESFESFSSFAKRLGVKVRHVENATKVLQSHDWLTIEPRGSRTYLSFRVKGLHGHRSTKLPATAYRAREMQIAAALECKELSQSARCVYWGLVSVCDKDQQTWSGSQRDAAQLIGMPRRTFRDAIQELESNNLMHVNGETLMPLPVVTVKVEADGRLVAEPMQVHAGASLGGDWALGGRSVGVGESENGAISIRSKPTLVTQGTQETQVPTPSESDRIATRRGRAVDLDRFASLYDLMTGAYARHDDRQTFGGIIRLSSGEFDWVSSDCFDADELQGFVRAGLLAREGQWVEITQAGHETIERFFMSAA